MLHSNSFLVMRYNANVILHRRAATVAGSHQPGQNTATTCTKHLTQKNKIHQLTLMLYVYILTNITKTVLYTGVTNNLQMRVAEHFYKRNYSFTAKYRCFNLIYYEEYATIKEAIAREKAIKNRSRRWKERLIERMNPEWKFYNEALFDPWPPDENYFR
jgi:putative endonuclease